VAASSQAIDRINNKWMRFKHVTEPADAFLARAYVELSSIDFNKSAPGPDKRERRWPDDRPAGHSRSPLALKRMVTRICDPRGKIGVDPRRW
jgi:hypothetical protein